MEDADLLIYKELDYSLSYHFVFLKCLIAPDILYLIKKAEKRISSLYESNKQKIL
jgi:hypothetical protein